MSPFSRCVTVLWQGISAFNYFILATVVVIKVMGAEKSGERDLTGVSSVYCDESVGVRFLLYSFFFYYG